MRIGGFRRDRATAGTVEEGRFRFRSGSALVPRLRRLRHSQQCAEGDAGTRHPAREDGVRLRHRLLVTFSVLHEHLRLSQYSRPRSGNGYRHQVVRIRI